MSDLAEKKQAFTYALILFAYWFVVFLIPCFIAREILEGHTPFLFWCVLSAMVGYFSYTGIRARRRGWRARFIQRIVIPASLLVAGGIFVGVLFRFDLW